jgi:hypothetical protein
MMEQYLLAYINYQQDNWVQFLPIAKCTANNHVSQTTGLSPFFDNYGMHPEMDFEPDIRVDNPEEEQAHSLADRIAGIHDIIKSKISFAQDRQQEYVDKH